MNPPAGVKREAGPKSMKERDRRAEAEKRAAMGLSDPSLQTAAPVAAEEETVDARGRRKKKKAALGLRYQRPAALNDLESQAELVDMDMIRQLERGFQMLSRFKATSAAFEADAHGRIKKEMKEDRAPRGIGAYARQHQAEAVKAEDPTWDRHVYIDPNGRGFSQDVLEKSTKVYNADSSPSAGGSGPMQFEPTDDLPESEQAEELKHQHALQLNLNQYVDAQQMIEGMAVVGAEGEGERHQHTCTLTKESR